MWIFFRIIRNVQKQLADLEKLCNLSNSGLHFFCIVLQMILICPSLFNLQSSNCVTLFHICFRIFQISPIFFYICLNFLSYLFFSSFIFVWLEVHLPLASTQSGLYSIPGSNCIRTNTCNCN